MVEHTEGSTPSDDELDAGVEAAKALVMHMKTMRAAATEFHIRDGNVVGTDAERQPTGELAAWLHATGCHCDSIRQLKSQSNLHLPL